jgi:hypothetical protein
MRAIWVERDRDTVIEFPLRGNAANGLFNAAAPSGQRLVAFFNAPA